MWTVWSEFSAIILIGAFIIIAIFLRYIVNLIVIVLKTIFAIIATILYLISCLSQTLKFLSDWGDYISLLSTNKIKYFGKKNKRIKKSLVISIVLTIIIVSGSFITKAKIDQYLYISKFCESDFGKELLGKFYNDESSKCVSQKSNQEKVEVCDLLYIKDSTVFYNYKDQNGEMQVINDLDVNEIKAYKLSYLLVDEEYYIKVQIEDGTVLYIKPQDIEDSKKHALVKVRRLNLRKRPMVKDGNILDTISKNDRVSIIFEEVNEKWTLISTKDYSGFVYGKHLEIIKEEIMDE